MTSTRLRVDQDVLKSKSLDQREALIIEREKLLDNSDRLAHLELLDKQIAIKEKRNTELDSVTALLEKSFDDAQKHNDESMTSFVEIETRCQSKLDGLAKDEETLREIIISQSKEKNNIEADILTRKQYLMEQENTVNDTIASWNIQLSEFAHEAGVLEEKKNKVNVDLVRATQDLQTKESDLQALQIKIDKLQTIYDQKIDNMKNSIQELKSSLTNEENKLANIIAQQTSRIEGLNTREKSIEVQETSLNHRELDLKTRENQLNVKLRLTQSIV